jgi:hypothetical protein
MVILESAPIGGYYEKPVRVCVCVCVCGGGGGGIANGLTYLLRIPRKLAVLGYTINKENLCRTFSGPK